MRIAWSYNCLRTSGQLRSTAIYISECVKRVFSGVLTHYRAMFCQALILIRVRRDRKGSTGDIRWLTKPIWLSSTERQNISQIGIYCLVLTFNIWYICRTARRVGKICMQPSIDFLFLQLQQLLGKRPPSFVSKCMKPILTFNLTFSLRQFHFSNITEACFNIRFLPHQGHLR